MVATPINKEQVNQVGRAQALPPEAKQVGLGFPLMFTTAQDYVFELTSVDQGGIFGIPRSIYINNGDNPSSLSVRAVGTQFAFEAPANSYGYYKLDSVDSGAKFEFSSAGGATGFGRAVIYNYEIQPNVWYKFGAFNVDQPIAVYGTANEGTLITDMDYPQPLMVAGINRITNTLEALSIDDTTGGVIVTGVVALDPAINMLISEIATNTLQTASNTAANSFSNITISTTTVVKALPGILTSVSVNTVGVGSTVELYDDATLIATIDSTSVGYFEYNAICGTNITVVTADTGTPADITVLYK